MREAASTRRPTQKPSHLQRPITQEHRNSITKPYHSTKRPPTTSHTTRPSTRRSPSKGPIHPTSQNRALTSQPITSPRIQPQVRRRHNQPRNLILSPLHQNQNLKQPLQQTSHSQHPRQTPTIHTDSLLKQATPHIQLITRPYPFRLQHILKQRNSNMSFPQHTRTQPTNRNIQLLPPPRPNTLRPIPTQIFQQHTSPHRPLSQNTTNQRQHTPVPYRPTNRQQNQPLPSQKPQTSHTMCLRPPKVQRQRTRKKVQPQHNNQGTSRHTNRLLPQQQPFTQPIRPLTRPHPSTLQRLSRQSLPSRTLQPNQRQPRLEKTQNHTYRAPYQT